MKQRNRRRLAGVHPETVLAKSSIANAGLDHDSRKVSRADID
jgi:hypothetical protein